MGVAVTVPAVRLPIVDATADGSQLCAVTITTTVVIGNFERLASEMRARDVGVTFLASDARMRSRRNPVVAVACCAIDVLGARNAPQYGHTRNCEQRYDACSESPGYRHDDELIRKSILLRYLLLVHNAIGVFRNGASLYGSLQRKGKMPFAQTARDSQMTRQFFASITRPRIGMIGTALAVGSVTLIVTLFVLQSLGLRGGA